MAEVQDEAGRLAALKGYGIVDTPNEPEFDGIVREAARLLGTPTALISVIDERRQWFKARIGMEARELPRAISFCSHVIGSGETMTVADAGADPRFADNPLVLGESRVRFYAGTPLRTAAGWRIGTLCVLDSKPHGTPTAEQVVQLETLAARTVTLFEARRARRVAREKALAA